jgi:Uma2 family endonuclease
VTTVYPPEEESYLQEQVQQQQESGGLPGFVVARLTYFLVNYADRDAKGWVFGADTDFKLPGLEGTLQPDVAFVTSTRLAFPDRNTVAVAPDLAVEVFSKTDSEYDMTDKVKDYLQAGVKMVWVVRLPAKLIEVHTQQQSAKPLLLGAGEIIEGAEVLPGFELPVDDIFVRLPPEALSAASPRRSNRKAQAE